MPRLTTPDLRAHTRKAHRALDSSLELMKPDSTEAEYVRFLQGIYSFHRVVEAQLISSEELCHHIPDMPERRRAHLAASDLESLGHAHSQTCDQVPTLSRLSQQLGAAYVFEGATLGGQFIARQMTARFSMAPDALRYVSAYGDRTPSMWSRFQAQLESVPLTAKQRAEALDTSTAIFASLQSWFDSARVPSGVARA